MIKDTKTEKISDVFTTDLVIVGTGAAGMSLAMEFIDSDIRVLLLEAGSENFDPSNQIPYQGEVAPPNQHGPLDKYRRRMLGGTTNVWGGRCSPFVESDFEERSYVENSGWPLCKSNLDGYYERAHAYCDVGKYDYTVEGSLSSNPKIIPDLTDDTVAQDSIWRFSLPTNFRDKYIKSISESKNIKLLLNATCVHIELDPVNNKIKEIRVASSPEKTFIVRAKKYVLATGGLETTRLLLASNNICSEGIGNKSGALGKFYASHLTGNFGEVQLTTRAGPVSWRYKTTEDGVFYKQQLRVQERVQREKGLLNTRLILTHPGFGNPNHGSGVLSGAYLVKWFFKGQIPPEYSQDLASENYQHVFSHFKNIILDSPRSLFFAYDWLTRRTFRNRKLPSIALKSKSNIYTLHFDSEQTHIPTSTITLINQKDAYGVPKLKVDWRYSESDVKNLFETYKVVSSAFEKSNAGKMLTSDDDVISNIKKQSVGSHHLGSTRMSNDPNSGVVDPLCKVYGTDNLYLASPSVFCSGSFANPFLTIVALAIRIGDQIKKEL